MNRSRLMLIIADLVRRKNSAPDDSPEQLMLVRTLTGLRYAHQEAGGIIEDIDPYWGAECRPLTAAPHPAPAGAQIILLPRRSGSRRAQSRA